MSTKIRDILASLLAITSSTVDSTPIGSTTPSTARFITPASDDNSTNAATTAWCRLGFTASLVTNGYIKFPTWLGGGILQWGHSGTIADGSPGTNVPFNTPFPNAVFAVVATDDFAAGATSSVSVSGLTPSAGATPYPIANGGFWVWGTRSGSGCYWFAAGN